MRFLIILYLKIWVAGGIFWNENVKFEHKIFNRRKNIPVWERQIFITTYMVYELISLIRFFNEILIRDKKIE